MCKPKTKLISQSVKKLSIFYLVSHNADDDDNNNDDVTTGDWIIVSNRKFCCRQKEWVHISCTKNMYYWLTKKGALFVIREVKIFLIFQFQRPPRNNPVKMFKILGVPKKVVFCQFSVLSRQPRMEIFL